jgi:hypothetical protein
MMFCFLTEQCTWELIQCTRELVICLVSTMLLRNSPRYDYIHLIWKKISVLLASGLAQMKTI